MQFSKVKLFVDEPHNETDLGIFGFWVKYKYITVYNNALKPC